MTTDRRTAENDRRQADRRALLQPYRATDGEIEAHAAGYAAGKDAARAIVAALLAELRATKTASGQAFDVLAELVGADLVDPADSVELQELAEAYPAALDGADWAELDSPAMQRAEEYLEASEQGTTPPAGKDTATARDLFATLRAMFESDDELDGGDLVEFIGTVVAPDWDPAEKSAEGLAGWYGFTLGAEEAPE